MLVLVESLWMVNVYVGVIVVDDHDAATVGNLLHIL